MKYYKELIAFFSLLFLSVGFIYFTPKVVYSTLALFILLAAWRSKKDYFWLAFFFILNDYPGGLFSGGLASDPNRIPLYTFAPGLSFTLTQLFYLMLFLKIKKKYSDQFQPTNFFNPELKSIVILFIILIVLSPVMGFSLTSFSRIVQIGIALIIFYVFFKSIRSKEIFYRFLNLIFPFAFIALLLQLYSLVNGHQLITLFKPSVTSIQGILGDEIPEGWWSRAIEMPQVVFVCFAGSLFLLSFNEKLFNRNYLIFVNIFAFSSILLSATRSWSFSFIFAYFLFFLFNGKKVKEIFVFIFIGLLLATVLFFYSEPFQKQIFVSLDRLSTVEFILKGDITAGGTVRRFDLTSASVIDGFLSSTVILGAGFSEHFFKYANGHVGYHNMLLNSGIIGFGIFIFIIISLLKFPFRFVKKYPQYSAKLKTSVIPLVILLIINSSTQTIGFTPDGLNRWILMSFSFLVINHSISFWVINKDKT